jgi:magnesium transporter
MNFEFMPELHWAYGYPWALGLMLVISISLVAFRAGVRDSRKINHPDGVS